MTGRADGRRSKGGLGQSTGSGGRGERKLSERPGRAADERAARRREELIHTLFQAHPWHGVPTSAGSPYVFNAFIEIVPSDTVKYELDKRSGHLRLDRPQRFSSLCPTPYGFLPQTFCGVRVAARAAERALLPAGLEGDGDPLDVCLLTENPIAHGVLAHVRPIGGLRMIDGNQADDKIIAVLEADVAYGAVRDIGEVSPGTVERLRHYFLTYKQRPDDAKKKVQIAETYDAAEALEVIARSVADYVARFGEPDDRVEELVRLLRPA